MHKRVGIYVFYLLIIIVINIMYYSDLWADNNSCGPLCLKVIADIFNKSVSTEELFKLSLCDEIYGTNIYALYYAAKSIGLPAVPIQTNISGLKKIKLPAIVHYNGNHFIVVHKIGLTTITVEDPPNKISKISKKFFLNNWSGVALVFSKKLSYKYNPKELYTNPHLLLIKNKYYFGHVSEGDTIKYCIKLSNNGSQPLVINVRPSCGCIKTNSYRMDIKPGVSEDLIANFNTNNLSGFVEHQIYLSTNDPKNDKVCITVSAHIDNEKYIVPMNVNLGDIPQDEKLTKDILVYDSGSGNLSVKKVITPNGITATIMSPYINEYNRRIIKIKLTGSAGNRIGKYNDSIKIIAFDKNEHIFDVAIEGNIVSKIVPVPQMLFFKNVKNGSLVIRKAILLIDDDYNAGSINAISSLKGLDVKISDNNDGTYILEAIMKNNSFAKGVNGEIRIMVDHSKIPACEIIVYIK